MADRCCTGPTSPIPGLPSWTSADPNYGLGSPAPDGQPEAQENRARPTASNHGGRREHLIPFEDPEPEQEQDYENDADPEADEPPEKNPERF